MQLTPCPALPLLLLPPCWAVRVTRQVTVDVPYLLRVARDASKVLVQQVWALRAIDCLTRQASIARALAEDRRSLAVPTLDAEHAARRTEHTALDTCRATRGGGSDACGMQRKQGRHGEAARKCMYE